MSKRSSFRPFFPVVSGPIAIAVSCYFTTKPRSLRERNPIPVLHKGVAKEKLFLLCGAINGCVLSTSSPSARPEPPFLIRRRHQKRHHVALAAVIGKVVWIPNPRRHGFIYLDNLLSQRARRPFGLRGPPLFYYLPLFEESET